MAEDGAQNHVFTEGQTHTDTHTDTCTDTETHTGTHTHRHMDASHEPLPDLQAPYGVWISCPVAVALKQWVVTLTVSNRLPRQQVA